MHILWCRTDICSCNLSAKVSLVLDCSGTMSKWCNSDICTLEFKNIGLTCYLIQFRIVTGCLLNSVRFNNWFNSIIVQHIPFYRQLYDWVNWTLFNLVIWFNSIIIQHIVFYRQLYDSVNWTLFSFVIWFNSISISQFSILYSIDNYMIE